ncbi:MAG: type II CRISPR-associated endonuclease Cas1 [Clostridia bacterium]|nr:type II CRISPR-associated endonuclease Cas1 [Clostridia bacterium]
MSFRTVIIKQRCKLDYCMNYLVYRGEMEKKIHLSEISILILESTAISITTALMNELIKYKVKVIFCDEKHMPTSQLIGFYDNYHCVFNIQTQINWDSDIKAEVWTNIIRQKITNQMKLLKNNGCEYDLLDMYLDQIEEGDKTNREGHAAKVYFNDLFNMLNRRNPSFYNSALNYGYAILLSAFCREITAQGYLTQLGIWHCNEFNYCNLACDLMETFRTIVDELALQLEENDNNYKSKMANVINCKAQINNKKVYLETAIEMYCKSVFKALNSKDVSLIKNIQSYELPIYENISNV